MLTHLAGAGADLPRVVVLGRAGFLAGYLRAELSQAGHAVVAVGRPELDLTERSSVATLRDLIRPDDAVVMTAALTPDRGKDVATLMANLRMGEHVCRAFEGRSCAQFVYVSSDGVYDGRDAPMTERSSREPAGLYPLAHTAREMMVTSALEAARVPCCIVRPVALYGPGDTHYSYGPNRFVRDAVERGRITLFGRGDDERSHLHIRDAARLVSLSVRRRSVGVLNLASPETPSFRRLAELVAGACALPVAIDHVDRPGGGPASARPFDVTAVRDAFPEFAFTPLAAGIADLVAAETAARRSPSPA